MPQKTVEEGKLFEGGNYSRKYGILFLHHKNFKIKSMVVVYSSPLFCILKNGRVHEGGKVGRSNATPTKLFSVYSYDLKFMSFKFGNDIFIAFEIPR